MRDGYHNNARRDVLPWLPVQAARCFDLGCGAGETLALLRCQYPDAWLSGLEMDEASARLAEQNANTIWCSNAETFDYAKNIEAASLDLILCLDVLEHLADPWAVVRQLSGLLRPGGCLITSIPNIRYYKVIRDLAVHGSFNYTESGALDRTHLRFFVRKTAEQLATCGGLVLKSTAPVFPVKTNGLKGILNRISGGKLDDLLITQYMIVAEKVS